jgi:hypothetical protein
VLGSYPVKNQQPRVKAVVVIGSISDKELSKSDTGFSECFAVRRHGQEQIKLMAAHLEIYPRGKHVGAANLNGDALALNLSPE